jgi:predicted Zn-dependent protease
MQRLQADPRIEMTAWVEGNIPEGERIVLERGGPFPRTRRYTLEYVDFLGQATPEEYRARGVRYLVGTGEERRVAGEARFAEVLANLERIGEASERAWSSGRFAIYRLRGSGGWEDSARTALRQNDPRRALSLLERVTRGGDATPFAWKMLGEVRIALGDTLGAIEAYREATDLDSTDVESPLALSNLMIARAAYDTAIELLQRASQIAPEDPLIFHNLAVAHLYRAREHYRRGDRGRAQQDWEAAAGCASVCVTHAPGDPEIVRIAEQVQRMGTRWGFR